MNKLNWPLLLCGGRQYRRIQMNIWKILVYTILSILVGMFIAVGLEIFRFEYLGILLGTTVSTLLVFYIGNKYEGEDSDE